MLTDRFYRSGDKIPCVALFVQHSPVVVHTGFAFRDEKQDLRRLHFILTKKPSDEHNGQIKTDDWDATKYPYVIPNLLDEESGNLASLCRVVSIRYKVKKPNHLYSIRRSTKATVNTTDGTITIAAGYGMTCSTFILVIADAAFIDLVDEDNWPHRPQDDERNDFLLQNIEANKPLLKAELLEPMRNEKQVPRFAPEEVVGSGMCPKLPAAQDFASAAGKWLISQITEPTPQPANLPVAAMPASEAGGGSTTPAPGSITPPESE